MFSGVRGGAVLILLCMSSCSTGPTVRTQVDPTADLSKFKTFGFHSAVDKTQAGYASFLSRYIRDAVSEQMKLRGYAPADAPDLVINYHLQTADKVSVQSTPVASSWRYGYRWSGGVAYETDVSTYKEGTLIVDVIDGARSELLWEGVAIGRISRKALDNPQPAVATVVAQIFEKYPARSMAQ
jgi:Domain of unknown function (DUF4136)